MAKLARSRNLYAGVMLLATMTTIALFAELIAADSPILAIGRAGVQVLPAVTRRAEYGAMTREEIEARHRDDAAIWPLVRSGPARSSAPLAGPSRAHPLGTDGRGLDVLAALVYGARAALAPAMFGLLCATLLGYLLGGLAGYLGGVWDEALSRPIEVIQTLPTIVVAALVMAIDPGRSGWTLACAITMVRWAEIARIMRVETMRIASLDYVAAARALGCSHGWILRQHVLPNATRGVVTSAIFALPSLVLLEAAVGFLGIGAPSSWGTLIAQGLAPNGSPWASCCGIGALLVTVASLRWIAEAVCDALDSRQP
jgi:peptide/nickel transport system permease protein